MLRVKIVLVRKKKPYTLNVLTKQNDRDKYNTLLTYKPKVLSSRYIYIFVVVLCGLNIKIVCTFRKKGKFCRYAFAKKKTK